MVAQRNQALRRLETVSDRQLLAEIVNGNIDALASLYDRHGQYCWMIASGVAPGRESADDAVFEAFLRTWCEPSLILDDQVGASLADLTRSVAVGWNGSR